MKKEYPIPDALVDAARQHFFEGVPITALRIRRDQRSRMERIATARRMMNEKPTLDSFSIFKNMHAGKHNTMVDDWQAAKRDQMLYEALFPDNSASRFHREE